MTNSTLLKPERRLQLMFIKGKFFSSLAVAIPIFAMAVWHNGQPSRWPGPDRTVDGRAEVVEFGRNLSAWRLSALRHDVSRKDFDDDFMLFVAIASETDHLPVGEVRKQYSPDALQKADTEIEEAEKANNELCSDYY